MNLPRFITFTGADDDTDIEEMIELAKIYPIEWGILFSPTRRGSPRYPSIDWVTELVTGEHALRLSAHLCGGYSRGVLERGYTDVDLIVESRFARAQVNTADRRAGSLDVQRWAAGINVQPIIYPAVEEKAARLRFFLSAASGGHGIVPQAWPSPPPMMESTFVGYAGGLRPENVATHLKCIAELASDYWLDMESGVRDEDDQFSLSRCRRVCEIVYGQAAA